MRLWYQGEPEGIRSQSPGGIDGQKRRLTVEQSTKSLPFTLPSIAVAIVSLIAASSPKHVKMMSPVETASSRLDATFDFPEGNFA